MRATLIITGNDMQVNLEADDDAEKRILGVIKAGAKFTAVNGSNISLSRGGCLRSFDTSMGVSGRDTVDSIALLKAREVEE